MPVYLVSYDIPKDVKVTTEDIWTFLERVAKSKDKVMPILYSVVLIDCDEKPVSLKELLLCEYANIHWFISIVNRNCQIIYPINDEVEKWISMYVKNRSTDKCKVAVKTWNTPMLDK